MATMTVTIDPHGDVLLVLSSSARLLVSSKILSTASPVFAAMFSPHFLEGRSLSTASPAEVPLPDDPPSAVETICNILHFHHDLIQSNLSFNALFDIALVADKYDLARALGPWRELWLRRLPLCSLGLDGRPERDGREGQEVFVRYVFSDHEGFEAVTRKAIIWGDGLDGWGCEALPDNITESIAATRIDAIDALIDIADHYRLLYQAPGVKCKVRPATSSYLRGNSSTQSLTCDAAILGSLVRHYSDIGIFPTPPKPYCGLSVGGLAKGLKDLRCYVDFDAGHGVCLVVGQVVKKTEEVLGAVKGLEVADYKRGGGGGGGASGGRGKGCGFVWVKRGVTVPCDDVRAPVQGQGVGSLFGGGG